MHAARHARAALLMLVSKCSYCVSPDTFTQLSKSYADYMNYTNWQWVVYTIFVTVAKNGPTRTQSDFLSTRDGCDGSRRDYERVTPVLDHRLPPRLLACAWSSR